MKVLGVLGSPHKNGGSAQLLHSALKAAEMEGAKTELICVYDGEIKPCIGCVQDEEPTCKFPCIFDDFGKIILEKIYEADGLGILTTRTLKKLKGEDTPLTFVYNQELLKSIRKEVLSELRLSCPSSS